MERFRYRVYVLNPIDGIELAIDLFCENDEVAVERAKMLGYFDIELWRGSRKISRLLHDDPSIPIAPE